MKKVKIILTVVVFLLATSAVVYTQIKKDSTNETQVVFSVGMGCQSCEQKVREKISHEKGVKNLTTNLDKKLVTITYKTDKTDMDKLQKSIENLGLTCSEVK